MEQCGYNINSVPGTVTQTTWYQVSVQCQSTQVFSNVVEVTVNNPQITGTTGATRCGPGTLTLQATALAGNTLKWYNSATGVASVGTGTSFTTPTISSTTDYYVAASARKWRHWFTFVNYRV
ncbi:MAG: hypothetical protein IPJ79_05180 [Bacteroidetes bacterium]|nr:hypothetical protein [Bacteroidota bacterium]